MLPWVPIVGTMAIVIALLLISNLGLFIINRRQQQFQWQLNDLPKGNIQNYDYVIGWLTLFLGSLKHKVVEGNRQLRNAIEKLRQECMDLQKVGFDGDESSDIENRPQITKLKVALDQLLRK